MRGSPDQFLKDIDRMLSGVERGLDLVFPMSVDDAMDKATRRATSQTRGGTIKPGYVPVDTGNLSKSWVAKMWGSTMMTTSVGADSYSLVVDKLRWGDTAQIGMTAPYAKAMHFGYRRKDGTRKRGWLWIELVARMWPIIVIRNAKKVRASL